MQTATGCLQTRAPHKFTSTDARFTFGFSCFRDFPFPILASPIFPFVFFNSFPHFFNYSITLLTRINWHGEPSRYGEFRIIGCFFNKLQWHFEIGLLPVSKLRCCDTSRMVAGSIPAGVIGIFH